MPSKRQAEGQQEASVVSLGGGVGRGHAAYLKVKWKWEERARQAKLLLIPETVEKLLQPDCTKL